MTDLEARLFAATLRTDLPALDLHGHYTREVEDRVGAFIFGLVQKKESAGKIIYGFGTGALRETVLGYLSAHPEVATLQEQSGSCIIVLPL